MNINDLFLVIGGHTVILVGLFTWLGKIWANRIQDREKARLNEKLLSIKSDFDQKLDLLNARNQPKVHVSKIQYEREYDKYAKIWDLTSALSKHINLLVTAKDSFENYKKICLELASLKSDLDSKVKSAYPFIDERIYGNALQCVNILAEYAPIQLEYLHYLEGTEALEDFNEEKMLVNQVKMEDKFDEFVEVLSSEFHNALVELANSIRNRNFEMIVIPSFI